MLSFSFIVSLEKNHFFFMGSDPNVAMLCMNLFMDFEIQSVSDLFSILFKMEGQADLEIAASKDLANLSEDALFLHFKNGYINR